MSQQKLEQYRDENTREIELSDGSMKSVRLTPQVWDYVEFLREVEGLQASHIASFAMEEMKLQQDCTFDEAFRCVVVYLGNRWK